MAYEIRISENAKTDYRALDARWRSVLKNALEVHLRHEPEKVSRSGIKRLRGIRKPQYRLRVGEIRVFYDVADDGVNVLAIVPKSRAAQWLARHGVTEDDRGSEADPSPTA